MRRFWRRGGRAELESRLMRRREPARPEYVHQLARELRSTGRRRLAPVRLLLAAALTLMMLVAVASVGGVASGALVRDHVVAVAKSLNKKVTAKQKATAKHGASWRYADDDDDDNGDDDDADDDQYDDDRRACVLALQQAHRIFHQQSQFTLREHRLYHQQSEDALEECEEIGR